MLNRVGAVHAHVQGWAGFTSREITVGAFVCQYAGELLNSADALSRLAEYDHSQSGAGHALLVSRVGGACLAMEA